MPERFADHLDIFDQVPGGVGDDAGMRARPATAALVKQDDAVDRGVEVAAHRRRAAAARPAVEDDDGDAIGPPALFHIDAVTIAHVDHALIERIDRRVKKLDCALLT